jgi:hypothetical protein
MNPDQKKRLTELFTAHAADSLSPEEHAELQTHLRTDTEARQWWFVHQDVEMGLRAQVAAERLTTPKARVSLPWFSWRPLTAAAAGLVMGLFGASMVFAYVAPSLGKVITLLRESFESGPAPLVAGVPLEPGKWSGDYSEVVEQQSVKPASGKKMLRFLRGDYEGRDIPSSHSSDVFRLVDVRPFRREFADGGAVVQLTAVFNALPFPVDGSFNATLTLFALDASLVGNEIVKGENVLSVESLAFSRSSRVGMDRDPATWQKVSNELRLPPSTEFLMVRMGMSNNTKLKDKRRDRFAGHFADNVQLVIARRPEIPVP